MSTDRAADRDLGGQTARPLDGVDRAIVKELCDNGRISMIELAQKVGISRGNAYLRYDRLRRDGVIGGFTARVDPRRLGLAVADFVVLVRARDTEELRDVVVDRLPRVPGVRNTLTTLILDEQLRGTPLPPA